MPDPPSLHVRVTARHLQTIQVIGHFGEYVPVYLIVSALGHFLTRTALFFVV